MDAMIPAAGTLKLTLSLMMDQKASLLTSDIGRREYAGLMLEPSVLPCGMQMTTDYGRNRDICEMWMTTNCGRNRESSTRPHSKSGTCQTQCITELLDIQEHAK